MFEINRRNINLLLQLRPKRINFKLLSLPKKIRKQVLTNVLLNAPRSTSILSTCRQICQEGTEILYSKFTIIDHNFRITKLDHEFKLKTSNRPMRRFLKQIGAQNQLLIRTVNITCTRSEFDFVEVLLKRCPNLERISLYMVELDDDFFFNKGGAALLEQLHKMSSEPKVTIVACVLVGISRERVKSYGWMAMGCCRRHDNGLCFLGVDRTSDEIAQKRIRRPIP